jgi:glycosyltransferase involved in cell wall biosynthesis
VKPLRIAVDARELAGHVTGVGVYLMRLLPHLLAEPGVSITLISHKPLAAAVDSIPNSAFAKRIVKPGKTGGTLWEQIALPRIATPDVADVLFAPAYTAPLASRIPVVLTIHDVSFAAHPEWFAPRERLRRNAITRRAARRAAAVLTVSDFSAQEIASRLGIDRRRLHVIPNAAPDRPGTTRPVSARDPVVVYVGSIFNRRHVPDLIAAFAAAAESRPDARLVIAGANRTWPREDIAGLIARSAAADRITWLQGASNNEISSLLARASVSAFFSEYEGFALTPFEALAHGVAPVMLDTPIAREIYRDAAIYVPKGDIPAAAAALGRLLDSAPDRAALVDRSGPMWSRYDGAQAARDTLAVLRSAAS